MHRRNAETLRRALILTPLALVASAGLACASGTFPTMRPGFWTSSMVMHMNMAGQPPDTDNTPRVTYNCLDADTMAASMKAMEGGMSGCVFDIEGSGANYTVTTNCKNPEGLTGTMTGNGTITTVGDTAMHMTETSSSDLSNMRMTSDMTGDSKWLGSCPAGTVPGDYGTMENGVFKKQGNTLTKN